MTKSYMSVIAIMLALMVTLSIAASPVWECSKGEDTALSPLLCGPYTIPDGVTCTCTPNEAAPCPNEEVLPGYIINIDTQCEVWTCKAEDGSSIDCPEPTCSITYDPEPTCSDYKYFNNDESTTPCHNDGKPIYDCAPQYLCLNNEDALVVCDNEDPSQFTFVSCEEDATRIQKHPYTCYSYKDGLEPVALDDVAKCTEANVVEPTPTLPVKSHPAALEECNAIRYLTHEQATEFDQQQLEEVDISKLIDVIENDDVCTLPLAYAYGPLKPVDADDSDDEVTPPVKEQCSYSYLHLHTLCFNTVTEALVDFSKCQPDPVPVQDTVKCGDVSQCAITHSCRNQEDGQNDPAAPFAPCAFEFRPLREQFCDAESIDDKKVEIQCAFVFTKPQPEPEPQPDDGDENTNGLKTLQDDVPDYTTIVQCPYDPQDDDKDDDDKDGDDKDGDDKDDTDGHMVGDEIAPYLYTLDCAKYTFKCHDVNDQTDPVTHTEDACSVKDPLICLADTTPGLDVKCYKNDVELPESDLCAKAVDSPTRTANCPEYRCNDAKIDNGDDKDDGDDEEEDSSKDENDDDKVPDPTTALCSPEAELACDYEIDEAGKCGATKQRTVYCFFNGEKQPDNTKCNEIEHIPSADPEPCTSKYCFIQQIHFDVEQVDIDQTFTITWKIDGDDQEPSPTIEKKMFTFEFSSDKSFEKPAKVEEVELDVSSQKSLELTFTNAILAGDYYLRILLDKGTDAEVAYHSVKPIGLLKGCLRDNHLCQNEGECLDTHACKCSLFWSGLQCEVDECEKLQCKHTTECKIVKKEDKDDDSDSDDDNKPSSSTYFTPFADDDEDGESTDGDDKQLVCDCKDTFWAGKVCDTCDIKCVNGQPIGDLEPDVCACHCPYKFGGVVCDCEAIYATLFFSKGFVATETIKTLSEFNAHIIDVVSKTGGIDPSLISIYSNNLGETVVKNNKYRLVLRLDACKPTKEEDSDSDTNTNDDTTPKQYTGLTTTSMNVFGYTTLQQPVEPVDRKTLEARWKAVLSSKALENDQQIIAATGGSGVVVEDVYDPYCTGPNCPSGTTPIDVDEGSGGLSTGMKWLIALLVILGVIILAIIVFVVVRKIRGNNKEPNYSDYNDDMLLEM